mgnify:CR=1 FL=1
MGWEYFGFFNDINNEYIGLTVDPHRGSRGTNTARHKQVRIMHDEMPVIKAPAID